MVLDSALLTVLIPVVLLLEIEVSLFSDLYLVARFLQQGSLPKHLTNPRLNDLLNIQSELSLTTQVRANKAIMNFLGKFKLQTVYVRRDCFSDAISCIKLCSINTSIQYHNETPIEHI